MSARFLTQRVRGISSAFSPDYFQLPPHQWIGAIVSTVNTSQDSVCCLELGDRSVVNERIILGVGMDKILSLYRDGLKYRIQKKGAQIKAMGKQVNRCSATSYYAVNTPVCRRV